MKTLPYILILELLITFVLYGQQNEKINVAVDIADTLLSNLEKKELERFDDNKNIKEEENSDSLRLDKILKKALNVAYENYGKERFIEKYDDFTDSIPTNVEIKLDYYFTKTNPHLIIRRNDPSAIYIDIYSKSENKFKKIVSHEQWTLTYVNDTIKDINGDGLNDFVVNWYGANGCCLKAFSNVYLLRKDKKSFSKNFEFINPTFSPKEKIIRGVCYGHPGETEMYKYKWSGEKVETLEYVSYQKNKKGKTGKIIISSYRPRGSKIKTLKVLNSVPTEYKKIVGYDWFTGKGYE